MGVGAKVSQACLVAFNFIFVLIGLAGIIVGAIIKLNYNDYINLTSKDIGGVSILMIVVGSIIFVIAFFGCCGALKRNATMLTIYAILLIIILLLEIAAAITAYVYKSKLKGYVKDGITYAMDHYDEHKYKKAIDDFQKEFDCCGVSNYSEWYNTTTGRVPNSCCSQNVSANSTCPINEIYDKGCADELFDFLNGHLAIIGGLGIAIAIIQIAGIIFACIVRRDIKDGYGYV